MRIRKRKVPLPLSQLSPIPITDPYLFSRSPAILVQPAHQEDTSRFPRNDSQPSDELTTSDLHRSIDDGNSSSDHHRHVDCMVKGRVLQVVGCLGVGGVESMPKSNDASNKSITTLRAAADKTSSKGPSPPSNHEERARCCNEYEAMPLTKRRGSIKEAITNVIDMTSNSSDNCVQQMNDVNTITAADNSNEAIKSGKKGGKRGKTILEGSRCSRVNGRGWRCCQPTLVGYSLCEHHLGKGRLRSMSSVRGRPSSMSKKAVLGMSSSEDCSSLMQLCEAAKKESEMLGNTVGKRVKLGVVKARSLSSLLGQTTSTTSFKDGGLKIEVQGSDKDVNEGNVDM